MKPLDRLTDAQVLALARFIAACARLRASTRWRTHFADCAARNHFLPFATLSDQQHLRELIHCRGDTIVCRLRTIEIIDEGNAVAREWNEPPVQLPAPEPDVPIESD